jgi:hypothetical protein
MNLANKKKIAELNNFIAAKRMTQDAEEERGFPNGDLWNNVEDEIYLLRSEIRDIETPRACRYAND